MDLISGLLNAFHAVVKALDCHEGFFMVTLTGCLVVIAWKSAKIALKTLDIMKRNDADRTRPYVVLEIVDDMPFYGVRMVNLGQTAARNIVVNAQPEIRLVFSSYNRPIKFLSEPVKYLAPNGKVQTDIGSFKDIEKSNPEKIYTGTISYEDDKGNPYVQEFVLDFSVITDAIHKGVKTVHDIAKQLEILTREFGHLASGFHKPHVLVEDYMKYEERVMEGLQIPAVANVNGDEK